MVHALDEIKKTVQYTALAGVARPISFHPLMISSHNTYFKGGVCFEVVRRSKRSDILAAGGRLANTVIYRFNLIDDNPQIRWPHLSVLATESWGKQCMRRGGANLFGKDPRRSGCVSGCFCKEPTQRATIFWLLEPQAMRCVHRVLPTWLSQRETGGRIAIVETQHQCGCYVRNKHP